MEESTIAQTKTLRYQKQLPKRKKPSFRKITLIRAKIIGIILIIFGICFFYDFTSLYMKIGVTFIIIGIFMIFLITEKSILKDTSDVPIILVLIAWVIAMFFFTGDVGLDIFFIMIFLGMLIIRELADTYSTIYLKKKMDIFTAIFLIVYIGIITYTITSA